MPRQDSDYIRLRDAIKYQDRQTAINLILQNVNLNHSGIRSHTPLHWAIIKFRDLEIMTMLLDRGANIHMKNNIGQTPLDIAILHRKTNAIRLLIERGALIGENLSALLIKAIERSSEEIVKMLIDHGLQYNPSVNLKGPLKLAISKGLTKIIEYILPHCPSLKPSERYIPDDLVKDYNKGNCIKLLLKWNFTMDPNTHVDRKYIISAVKEGYSSIVSQLLKRGINVNLKDPESGLNLLQMACFNKHSEIVKNLLKHNAFVNVITPPKKRRLSSWWYFNRNTSFGNIPNNLSGITCLHIAVYNNDPMTVKHLLRYGIRIIDDPTFFNITCIAIQKNHEEIVRIFLDYGVDVNEFDSAGKTLLHYCVSSYSKDSRYKIAEMLFERGADVHVQIPGSSLLFEAIQYKHFDIAHLFLSNHGDVQYINPDGNTPLHMATANDFDIEFIKTLLQKGANPNATNNKSLTPLHMICDPGYTTTTRWNNSFNQYRSLSKNITQKIELLLKNNANIEAVDRRGRTPLLLACSTANLEAVKCLVNNHANVHHTDLENFNTLYIAASRTYGNCDFQIMEILFKHKVNVHCMDKLKESLIHVATNNRNLELIKRLVHTQVNFNSANTKGNTPLHSAVQNQSLDVTKILVKYGANVNILDKKKQTPLQNAVNAKNFIQTSLTKHRHYFENGGVYSGDSNGSEYNSENDMGEINNYKKIIKILKTQIIKLKAAELKVNKQNLNLVYNSNNNGNDYDPFSDPDDYYYEDCRIDTLQLEVKCAREIEKMRMHIIVNNITFYDLLKNNIHYLSKFVKNRQIQKILKLSMYDEKFPLYIDIVRSRFRDAKFRYRLMNSAEKYFNINIYPLTDNCVDNIFSYLNIKEIKMIIRALKPLNE